MRVFRLSPFIGALVIGALPLVVFALLLAVMFGLARPAHAAGLGEVLANPAYGIVAVIVTVGVLLALGWLCRAASALLTERTHASRVTRAFDTAGSVADGIAEMLLAHAPGTPAATLRIVREAAVAQGVAYLRVNMPDTLKAIGVSNDTLAARINNEVSARLNGVVQSPEPLAASSSPASASTADVAAPAVAA